MPTTAFLLRTNPALSGNIKICVSDNLYLDTFETGGELAKSIYKGYVINPSGVLSADVSRYLGQEPLPHEVVYGPWRLTDDVTVKKSFDVSMEKQYCCGVSRCSSAYFQEQYKFLAPIWLSRRVPKYFIILKLRGGGRREIASNPAVVDGLRYRVAGSGYVEYGGVQYSDKEYFQGGQQLPQPTVHGAKYIMDDSEFESKLGMPGQQAEMLSESELVKVFDLTDSSKIGSYLRRHVNDLLFKEHSVEVDYDEQTITYCGINLFSGMLGEKIESMKPMMTRESSILDFEEFVTDGFKRNSMLSANLLNLEFYFDDPSADDYSFNRYTGMYVDDLDLMEFHIDKSSEFSLYPNPYYKDSFIQKNYGNTISDAGGITIKVGETSGYRLYPQDILPSNAVYYLKDKYGTFSKICNSRCTDDIRLADEEYDSGRLFGFDKPYEIPADFNVSGNSYTRLAVISEPVTGDRIDIMKGNVLIGSAIADELPDYPEQYGPGMNVEFYFYPYGTSEQVASGLAMAINSILLDAGIEAVQFGNNVAVINRNGIGNEDILFRPSSQFVAADSENLSNGSRGRGGIRVPFDISTSITPGSYLLTEDGYAKIKGVGAYFDEPDYDPSHKIIGFNFFDSYKVVSIEDQSKKILLVGGKAQFYNEPPLKVGTFSIFAIRDFDFSVSSSDYTVDYRNEYKKYFNSDLSRLTVGDTYKIYRGGSQEVVVTDSNTGVAYGTDTSDPGISSDEFTVAPSYSYSLVQGSPVLLNKKFYDDKELKQFIGFNSIAEESESLQLEENLEDKYASLVRDRHTEYHRLREDGMSSNSLRSKITPTISKWVMVDGKDVRGNEYRLNLSSAFGETSLSPSFDDYRQDPMYFTHEWYYLGGQPENISREDSLAARSYFDNAFDVAKYSMPGYDYFRRYFSTYMASSVDTSTGIRSSVRSEYQDRYSVFSKSSRTTFETFFRGVRILLESSDVDYSGYKFSSVLNIERTSTSIIQPFQKPITIKVLENREFKNIVVLITALIDDYKTICEQAPGDYIDYLYLYVMNSLTYYSQIGPQREYGLPFQFQPLPNGVTPYNQAGLISSVFFGTKIYLPYKKRYSSSASDLEFMEQELRLKDFFKANEAGSYGTVLATDYLGSLLLTSLFTLSPPAPPCDLMYGLSPNSSTIVSSANNTISLSNNGLGIAFLYSNSFIGHINPSALESIYNLENMGWFQQGGGYQYYSRISELLSFASIRRMIEDGSDLVEKLLISGGVQLASSISLRFLRPSQISRAEKPYFDLINVEIPEIPASVEDFVEKSVQESNSLYRYGGRFSPKMKDITRFTAKRVDRHFSTYWERWSDQSPRTWLSYWGEAESTTIPMVAEGIGYSGFLQQELLESEDVEIYIHKVSQNSILSAKNPVYPSIAEIAIDKNSIDPYKGNLEYGYFRRYLSKSSFEEVCGTFSMREDKSFLNTAIMNLDKSFSIGTYQTVAPGSNLLDESLSIGDNDVLTEVVTNADGTGTVTIRISKESAHYDYIYPKISTEFFRYVDSFHTAGGSDELALREFVSSNIIPIFVISGVELYVKKYNTGQYQLIYNEEDELALLNEGFRKDKNFKTKVLNNKDIIITYSTEKEFSYSFNPRITLTLQ